MPFKSEKQRRFMWAKHPEIARRWAEEYGSKIAKKHKKKHSKKVTAKAGPAVGGLPMDEETAAIMYGMYNEPTMVQKLAQEYADWQGDKREKMIFLTQDGQLIPFQGQGKNEVTVKLSDIIRGLAYKGANLGNVVGMFHNHQSQQDFSPEDMKLLKTLQKYGFQGGFHLFYPENHRIRTYENKKKAPK